jgi:hypothetical protein
LTTKTSLAFHEDSGESYGRCKISTTFREAKLKYHHHHQSSWTQPKCKQWLMRLSLQLLLKPWPQLSRLYLLLLLYQELSQGQPSSRSILLELAILHGTSRLARD